MGLLGGSYWRAQARVLQRQRASVLAEWVTHPARVSKITELRQPFHREKSTRRSSNEAEWRSLTMTSRRMPCGNMMRKEILDAVDSQTQCRTFSDIRDCRLQQAWQRVDVYVGAVCHPAKELGTSNARMHAPAATNTTGPIPMDLSFLVAKLIEKGFDRRIERPAV